MIDIDEAIALSEYCAKLYQNVYIDKFKVDLYDNKSMELYEITEYLKMLKPIMEIAAKDNGKSATKSFEYMDQIKEVLKPKIDKTGFNTEKQYMDIIETVKKKGYWDK